MIMHYMQDIESWCKKVNKLKEVVIAGIGFTDVGEHWDQGLDDLFVKPEFRGLKIGEKLIIKLNEISIKQGWGLVRCITRSDNLRAKSLYNRVSKKTNWQVYEL